VHDIGHPHAVALPDVFVVGKGRDRHHVHLRLPPARV
jgi:hypothetical protein